MALVCLVGRSRRPVKTARRWWRGEGVGGGQRCSHEEVRGAAAVGRAARCGARGGAGGWRRVDSECCRKLDDEVPRQRGLCSGGGRRRKRGRGSRRLGQTGSCSATAQRRARAATARTAATVAGCGRNGGHSVAPPGRDSTLAARFCTRRSRPAAARWRFGDQTRPAESAATPAKLARMVAEEQLDCRAGVLKSPAVPGSIPFRPSLR